MNEEQDLKLTDLDYLIGNHHLQMMKAALPYMKVPEQKTLSVFVKFNELQRTISLFRDEEVATMGICSLENKKSPLDMLKAIKPFGNSAEQDMIDLISNFMQGNRGHHVFQDLMAGGLGGGLGSMFGGGFGSMFGGGFGSANDAADDTGFSDNKSFDGFAEDDTVRAASAESFQKRNPMDQLKGFLSPERQSQLETMQLLMQTMQQLT